MNACSRHDQRTALSLAALGLSALAWIVPAYGDASSETKARLAQAVKYLASDELEGRGVGTKGLDKAAEFVRREFLKAGLDSMRVDGDAFQKFTMVTGSELGTPNTLELTGPEGKSFDLKFDSDFRTCSFGGSGSFHADIVFCGYGIDSADKKYQDFKDVDVEGKVVILVRRVPQQGNPHGPFGNGHGGVSRQGDLRTKVSNAFGKGAVAVLFVSDPFTSRQAAKKSKERIASLSEDVVAAAEAFEGTDTNDEKIYAAAREKLSQAVKKLQAARTARENANDDPLMKFGYGGKGKDRTLPIMHISQKTCDQLLQATLKKSLTEIEAEIDKDLKPRSTHLQGWKAKGATSVKRIRTQVKNVIGVIEGEGPLADETVVIGAHYDHVGLGGEGSLAPGSKEVHNGADDNASGTATLIELARRFAARKEKLPRRLVFIAFTAEELGLRGSARYVKEPIFPLDKTIAMINMDMVGRLRKDKLTVFGTGTAPRWKKLFEGLNGQHHFKLTLKPDGFGPSDQSSFYAKKIPVLHFFTGTHKDYHRPSDDWDKVNVEGMVRVADLIEKVVVMVAETKERPKYVEVKRKTLAARGGSRPYFGSIPDFGTEVEGYPISGTSPGSPAAKGGLKEGDVIVLLGKQKIGGLNDFDLALRKFSPGDDVNVVVLRNGKRVKLKVKLTKPR